MGSTLAAAGSQDMMADVFVDVMLGAPVARSFVAVAAGSKLGLALIEPSDKELHALRICV